MRRPRRASHDSSVPGIAPTRSRRPFSTSYSWSSVVTSAPSTASAWPERYLVAEWTTRSAPLVSGTLAQGSGEGVVDDDVRADVVRGRRDRLDVGDLQGRVRRGLEPDQRRVVAGLHDRVGVGDVDQPGGEPAARLEVGQLHDGAVVRVPRCDHGRALADQVEHRGDGRQAGGERQAAATLERAERLLERGPGRVAVAAVLQVAGRDVRRGHRDRCVQRGVRDVLRTAGRDGGGGGGPRAVAHGPRVRREPAPPPVGSAR